MLPGNSSFILFYYFWRKLCEIRAIWKAFSIPRNSQFKKIRNPISANVHKVNNKDALTTICEVLKFHKIEIRNRDNRTRATYIVSISVAY